MYKRQVKRLSAVIDETMTVEGDLRREIALNIKRLQEIGCYRGIRPVSYTHLTIEGLRQLKTPEEVARLRGKSVDEILA